MTFVPAIVRISGFSAEVMEPFSSGRCTQEIEILFQLERDLNLVRAELENRLFEKVSGAPDEVRRLLLSVKRDCHNGRSLAKWRSAQYRTILDQAVPGLMDRLFDLEDRLEVWRAQLSEVFCQERERERDVLYTLVEDRDFRRGLALAAPTLVRNLGRLRKKSRYGRKERGMDQSLLRYVSRTAFKLSPFSTFTRVGVGVLSDDVQTGAIQLREGAWLLKSLTRLKKQVPAQYFAILLHDETFLSRLDIRLNDTIERVADNKYRFIRAGRWMFSEEKRGLYFQLESLINVRLEGGLIEETQKRLGQGRYTYENLITELAGDISREVSEVASTVDRLIQIGFLQLQAPWQGTEADVDDSFLAYLRSLPESELLRDLIQVYERLETLK
ncbi:MAG TPA: lantibiotic dehydratase, partial [Thermoanaerobaculia bacterium]|nr:lantibiotic dehydratase [Thermoanaerobaculia bacterium]